MRIGKASIDDVAGLARLSWLDHHGEEPDPTSLEGALAWAVHDTRTARSEARCPADRGDQGQSLPPIPSASADRSEGGVRGGVKGGGEKRSRSQLLNWLVPSMGVLMAVPFAMVGRAAADVYFMVGFLCAAVGLGVERYVSSQNPSGDPLIPPRQAGVRAAIPWLAAAAIWLIAGAMT